MTSLPVDTLDWLEKQTNLRTNYPQMLCGKEQGAFLKMMIGVCGARRVLEVGTFTGYSAICMACALPDEGSLYTYDINDELEDLIQEAFVRSGLSSRLHFVCEDFLSADVPGPFDLIYIDADKRQYLSYYEKCLPLLRAGGVMLVDDTAQQSEVLAEFNKYVLSDSRVEAVLLPMRHGLTLVHKLP